jgi:ABC-type phosphate transport system permease subunit
MMALGIILLIITLFSLVMGGYCVFQKEHYTNLLYENFWSSFADYYDRVRSRYNGWLLFFLITFVITAMIGIEIVS